MTPTFPTSTAMCPRGGRRLAGVLERVERVTQRPTGTGRAECDSVDEGDTCH